MIALIDLFKNNLLWKHGREYIIFCTLLFSFGLFFSYLVLVSAIVLFCFFLWFFRNPSRIRPVFQSAILTSPADGKILSIEPDKTKNYTIISIFLSPLDVHVNWAPADVRVESVTHRHGAYYPAMVKKSSELNEAVSITLTHLTTGSTIIVRQIAGILARRIACWVEAEEQLSAGAPLGMIKLGSRVDLYVPKSASVLVAPGQYVYGIETVIAQLA